MDKIFDKLFFMGPMGLGDNFLISGMVHYYADRCHEMHVPVWPYFHESVSTLYQDHPHIRVVGLNPFDQGENQYVEQHKLSRILRTNLINWKIKNFELTPLWDLQLYAMHELSYDLRYKNFRLPMHVEGSEELYQKLSGGEPYVLVHRRTSNHPDGIPFNLQSFRLHNRLPDVKIIEIDPSITTNMMHYVKLIQCAEEIHCVPSSFHCLVDSMDTKARLYFHNLREKTAMVINSKWNKHRWTMVNYSERM